MAGETTLPARTDEPRPRATPEINPELFKQFLENQKRELELKARDIELVKQRDNNNFEWAKKSLDVQAEDRKQERAYRIRATRNFFILIGIIVAGVIALLAFAIAMNKEQVALEVVKAVIFALGGGAGGYAIGKQRKVESPQDTSPKIPK